MNLERIISRSLSAPRKVRLSLRRSINRRPAGTLRYTQLVDHLANAMIRGYSLGYRKKGATLRKASRDARLADYRRRAKEVLQQYGESATKAVSDTYRNARARKVSVKVATGLALKRFASLGHTAPVSNRLKALYNSAIRAAHEQGLWDATSADPAVWGYTVITHVDDRVRPTHFQVNRVTLPKEDDFWRTFGIPPFGWNCRCRLRVHTMPQKKVKPPPVLIPLEEGFKANGFDLGG